MNNRNLFEKVNYVDIESSEYPPMLKLINDPPHRIFYRGSWNPEIFRETLSVVGSRKMTGYGEIITERLVSAAAAAGITIVSGFMYGIDAVSHESAVDSGGKTIAVMPCGIERIHPVNQTELYRKILKKEGLVISEFEGNMQPARWTFPRRNRIIAALSPALLVVEAGLKSGALITAGYAFKYGRKILAVPGPLTSSVSLGTANLIKRGASIITSSEDILMLYGRFSLEHTDRSSKESEITEKSRNRSLSEHPRGDLEYRSRNKLPADQKVQYQQIKTCLSNNYHSPMTEINRDDKPFQHSRQQRIISLLSEEALSIDEISRKSGIPVSAAGSELTVLQLKKKVIQKGDKYYLKNR